MGADTVGFGVATGSGDGFSIGTGAGDAVGFGVATGSGDGP